MIETILNSVSVLDALQYYGYNTGRNKGTKGRAPCPIHNGVNNNFTYDGNKYYCHKCQAKGNSITLIRELFNIGFREACEKLNSDFRLNLNLNQASSKKDLFVASALRQAENKIIAEEKKNYLDLCTLHRTIFQNHQSDDELKDLMNYISGILDANANTQRLRLSPKEIVNEYERNL